MPKNANAYIKVIAKLSKVIKNYLKEKPAPVFPKNFSELNSFLMAHHFFTSSEENKFQRSNNRILSPSAFIQNIKRRSSCLQMFFKIGVLRPAFYKKGLQHRCFPVKIANFLRKPFL